MNVRYGVELPHKIVAIVHINVELLYYDHVECPE